LRELISPPRLEMLRVNQQIPRSRHRNRVHIEVTVNERALNLQASDLPGENGNFRIVGREQFDYLKGEWTVILRYVISLQIATIKLHQRVARIVAVTPDALRAVFDDQRGIEIALPRAIVTAR
jgi:hypothetical protein